MSLVIVASCDVPFDSVTFTLAICHQMPDVHVTLDYITYTRTDSSLFSLSLVCLSVRCRVDARSSRTKSYLVTLHVIGM